MRSGALTGEPRTRRLRAEWDQRADAVITQTAYYGDALAAGAAIDAAAAGADSAGLAAAAGLAASAAGLAASAAEAEASGAAPSSDLLQAVAAKNAVMKSRIRTLRIASSLDDSALIGRAKANAARIL